jgi:hypothetical protein
LVGDSRNRRVKSDAFMETSNGDAQNRQAAFNGLLSISQMARVGRSAWATALRGCHMRVCDQPHRFAAGATDLMNVTVSSRSSWNATCQAEPWQSSPSNRSPRERSGALVRRYLLSVVVAFIVAACGSEKGGITEPSTPATANGTPSPSKELVIHDSLNPFGNRSAELAPSYVLDKYIPMISTLVPWAWDDFTSAAADPIRTVSWQGGYCGTLASPGPPPASSIEFGVAFSSDYSGRPIWAYAPQARFTPADAHEQFAFYDNGCAYYDYTAALPTPFPVTAGKRYWLLIAAETSSSGSSRWGWRVGTQDNGISARGSHGEVWTSPSDLAFFLSSR